jgi:hypothetical protein
MFILMLLMITSVAAAADDDDDGAAAAAGGGDYDSNATDFADVGGFVVYHFQDLFRMPWLSRFCGRCVL